MSLHNYKLLNEKTQLNFYTIRDLKNIHFPKKTIKKILTIKLKVLIQVF